MGIHVVIVDHCGVDQAACGMQPNDKGFGAALSGGSEVCRCRKTTVAHIPRRDNIAIGANPNRHTCATVPKTVGK